MPDPKVGGPPQAAQGCGALWFFSIWLYWASSDTIATSP
jgi:hypothetical protein